MRKKLIIINGTMCVGKTVTCEELRNKVERCVWLDGDWCWMMNPWIFSEENKRMVEDNITYLLRNFLSNSSFEYVIFNWVIHKEYIFDMILDRIKDMEFDLFKISLLCSEEELKRRVLSRGGDECRIKECIERLSMYKDMDTIKIDTTDITPSQAADKIIDIIK